MRSFSLVTAVVLGAFTTIGATIEDWGAYSLVPASADDGPTQVVLPVPDRSRVIGVALGGPDKDTLFAFCGNRIWKRKIRQHAMGAFSAWTKVSGTQL